jgi:hypothetical protein
MNDYSRAIITEWLAGCGIELHEINGGLVYAGDSHNGPYGSCSLGTVILALRETELCEDMQDKFETFHAMTLAAWS